MKNKKGLIILSSVVAVCAIGLVVAPMMDWNVESEQIAGNIGKSSRFSRKTASESVTNMEELLLNDSEYKNSITSAYMVMQTRAQQFSVLVDMSNEVAGEIPEFADVLDEMNKTYVTINNVCASLVRAGENINATLAGQKRPDLAQNTINASLAYSTLQKQNRLATDFIDTTDEYLQKADGDDRLKFVRDQWVDYQKMTAALDGDEEAAKELEKKGTLLPAEKTASTLGSFGVAEFMALGASANIANSLSVDNSLSNSLPSAVIGNIFQVVGNVSTSVLANQSGTSELNGFVLPESYSEGQIRNAVTDQLGNVAGGQDFIRAVGWDNLQATAASQLNMTVMSAFALSSFTSVIGSFTDVTSALGNSATSSLNQSANICNQLGNAIEATAIGNKATLNIN